MKILIIEDKVALVAQVARLVERYCGECVVASATIESARRLFLEFKNTLEIIYLDGSLENPGEWDTWELMDFFKAEGFLGSIVSISDNTLIETKMLNYGCSESCSKMEIPIHAVNLLKK